MSINQPFRTAFRGFDREDVVRYIEYLNNHYTKQLEDLTGQLKAAQVAVPSPNADLEAKLAAKEAELQQALERCAQLEAQLAEKEEAASAVPTATEEELEAYRRAERTERQARDRAQQIYTQANAVLAEVTNKAETASAQVAATAEQVAAQLVATKATLEEAVAALYAIRPEA